MRYFNTVIACLICMLLMNLSYGQTVKVGYTNIELVLAYMPEAKSMEQNLQTYQKKLSDNLQVKEKYLQNKYQEYLQLKEGGNLSPQDATQREGELTKLDQEVKQLATESEQQLLRRRQELLEPVLTKLQNSIDKVAEANGYTYILNQTTSGGVSTILYGPNENDITELLMKDLGITIPGGN